MGLPGLPQDLNFACGGLKQSFQNLDRRRFTRAVRSEQAKALAAPDLKIQPANGLHLAFVGLLQTAALYRHPHAGILTNPSRVLSIDAGPCRIYFEPLSIPLRWAQN